jgi:hypothetical protein
VEDVEGVDFSNGRGSDGQRERALSNAHAELLALLAGEPLRIIHAAKSGNARRHDDGRCDDGAREGAPSDFIDTGDQQYARPA